MEAPADGYNSNWFLTSNLKDYKDSPYETIGYVSAIKTMSPGTLRDVKVLGSTLSGLNISGIDSDFEMIKRRCLAKMKKQAIEMGANGIIGIEATYQLMVNRIQKVEMQGTAIKIGTKAILGGNKKLTKKLRIKKAARSQFPRRKQKKTRSKRR
jgi:uncharacterized protein YbjQ (UPF0145 family)